MFLETVHTPVLAHLSYVIGDGGEAAVVDPRRDVGVYLDIARRQGARIVAILETHRNEDLVSGAAELSRHTGAPVLHGTALGFAYGQGAEHGHELDLGSLRLRVLHTPGHTDESISIAVFDRDAGGPAVGVFTGDALFVGQSGRTDFYPDRPREVAAALHASIHEQILPLGDQALLWPAHTGGSVCGADISSRTFSSLGHERATSPALQLDSREAFVEAKLAEEHVKAPYFRQMERYNLEGPPPLSRLPSVPPLSGAQVQAAVAGGAQVVDVRSPEAFAGSHVPGSLFLPLSMLASYAGWFLSYDRPVVLVAEDRDQVDRAVLQLVRIGYDDLAGWLADGMEAWHTAGIPADGVPHLDAFALNRWLGQGRDFALVDVRERPEWDSAHVVGAYNIFLGHLPDRLDDLPEERPLVTFCGKGVTAMIAASVLRRAGVDGVRACLGSLQGCRQAGCPIV